MKRSSWKHVSQPLYTHGLKHVLLAGLHCCWGWFGHLIAPAFLPLEVHQACLTGGRLRGQPRTCWRDYICRFVWKQLRVPPEELREVVGGQMSGFFAVHIATKTPGGRSGKEIA